MNYEGPSTELKTSFTPPVMMIKLSLFLPRDLFAVDEGGGEI